MVNSRMIMMKFLFMTVATATRTIDEDDDGDISDDDGEHHYCPSHSGSRVWCTPSPLALNLKPQA